MLLKEWGDPSLFRFIGVWNQILRLHAPKPRPSHVFAHDNLTDSNYPQEILNWIKCKFLAIYNYVSIFLLSVEGVKELLIC